MTIKSSKYQVYNGNTYDQLSFETLSKDVSITDADGLITATNVEDALQEIANKIGVLNGTGTIVEKANKSDLISHLADNLYQTAGGTGTAITLAISETLVNGLPVNFIASAANSGVATTINTKPLYKPNTTTAPNLVAGKPVTAIYNLTSDCFFIKASA